MRQRHLKLKAPRNEMPAPGDPRLKAYQDLQAIDRAAMLLVRTVGLTLEEAYKRAYVVQVPGGQVSL